MLRKLGVLLFAASVLGCSSDSGSGNSGNNSSDDPVVGSYVGVATGDGTVSALEIAVSVESASNVGLPFIRSAYAQSAAYTVSVSYEFNGQLVTVTGDLTSDRLTFEYRGSSCEVELTANGTLDSVGRCSGQAGYVLRLLQRSGTGQYELYCGVTAGGARLGFVVNDAPLLLASYDNELIEQVTYDSSLPTTVEFDVYGQTYSGTLDANLGFTADSNDWVVQTCASVVNSITPPVADAGMDAGAPDMGDSDTGGMSDMGMGMGDTGAMTDMGACGAGLACCMTDVACNVDGDCCTNRCLESLCSGACNDVVLTSGVDVTPTVVASAMVPLTSSTRDPSPVPFTLYEETFYDPTGTMTAGEMVRGSAFITRSSNGSYRVQEFRQGATVDQRRSWSVVETASGFRTVNSCDSAAAGGLPLVNDGAIQASSSQIKIQTDLGNGAGVERTYRVEERMAPCHGVTMSPEALFVSGVRSVDPQPAASNLAGLPGTEYVLTGITGYASPPSGDLQKQTMRAIPAGDGVILQMTTLNSGNTTTSEMFLNVVTNESFLTCPGFAISQGPWDFSSEFDADRNIILTLHNRFNQIDFTYISTTP